MSTNGEPTIHLHITTSESFSESTRPKHHFGKSSKAASRKKEDKFAEWNQEKEDLKELRQSRGDVVVVHGDKIAVFQKSNLGPSFALPGQPNNQIGFNTPANREYVPIGDVMENPKDLIPPVILKKAASLHKEQGAHHSHHDRHSHHSGHHSSHHHQHSPHEHRSSSLPPVHAPAAASGTQSPVPAVPMSSSPQPDANLMSKTQYFEFPAKELTQSTLRLEKVKKGETFLSGLQQESDLAQLLPEPRLKSCLHSFAHTVDEVMGNDRTSSPSFFATETGADPYSTLALFPRSIIESEGSQQANSEDEYSSSPPAHEHFRPRTDSPSIRSSDSPLPSEFVDEHTRRPSSIRAAGQHQPNLKRKGLSVSIESGAPFRSMHSPDLESTSASWDPAFGRPVASSLDTFNPIEGRSMICSRERSYLEYLSPYSLDLFEVASMKHWARVRGFSFERLASQSFAVLDDVISLIDECIPHDHDPALVSSTRLGTADKTSRTKSSASLTAELKKSTTAADLEALKKNPSFRSASSPPPPAAAASVTTAAASAQPPSALGLDYVQQFAQTKKELSGKLNEKLAARHKNREYVYKSSRYLSTLSSQATEDAENWQCFRLRPGGTYVDMWKIARERLTEEQRRARVGVVFYTRLLTFLDYIGAPTSQPQIAMVNYIRKLLIEGCPVDQRLFFEIVKAVGNDVLSQRDNVKIIHFMRIELAVDVAKFFKEAIKQGWQLSEELKELKRMKKLQKQKKKEEEMAAQQQQQQQHHVHHSTPIEVDHSRRGSHTDELISVALRSYMADARSIRSDPNVQSIITRVRPAQLQPQKTFYSSYYNNSLPPLVKRSPTPQQKSHMRVAGNEED